MAIQSDTHQAVEKLSISEALSQAFLPLFRNLPVALKLAFFPALTLAILGTTTFDVFITPVEEVSQDIGDALYLWLVQILLMIVSFFIMIQYFTSWVRFISKDEFNLKATILLFPSKRQLIAFAKGFAIFVVSYIVLILAVLIFFFLAMTINSGFIIAPFVIALIIAWLTLILRLSYVVPAATLDEPYSLKDSWKHTRSRSLPLFLSFFVLSIIYFVAALILAAAFAAIAGIFDISILSALSAGDLSGFLQNPNFIWMYFVFNLVTLYISFLFYTPYMNMYLYCFQTNSGWQKHENIAETFA
ncbi:hypothetical protein [Kiloniella antarctica]|uniref:Glycerophosphoryl diester phosphodiesterase membrane domain-containing protein n=1 Tax=Kiloniella antarctica TaxID=1550907 RepID=A0ABW5BIF8_9PROT